MKRNFTSLGMSIAELIIGILLLIDPLGFTSGIIIVFGIVMIIMGIVNIIRYFRTGAVEASQGTALTKGVILTVIGAFCTFRSDWFLTTFPVITILYGAVILVSGVFKLQQAVDMVRIRQKSWPVALIGALLTLIFALFIIFNPFTSTVVLWKFIGITLIIEAVMDILSFLSVRKA